MRILKNIINKCKDEIESKTDVPICLTSDQYKKYQQQKIVAGMILTKSNDFDYIHDKLLKEGCHLMKKENFSITASGIV